jgi:hypothetical protein
VPGPSSFVRAVVRDPAGCNLSSPHFHGEAAIAFKIAYALGTRNRLVFVATYPRPTRSCAYASPAPLPKPSQGSLPTWAGSPLAGRVSHPPDDERSFTELPHTPILFDQPCLVAQALQAAFRAVMRPMSIDRSDSPGISGPARRRVEPARGRDETPEAVASYSVAEPRPRAK